MGCSGGDGALPPPLPPPELCDHTVRWANPVEDINGNILGPTNLTHATIYVGQIPNAPDNEIAYTLDIDAYALSWELRDQPPGTYWLRLTVSNMRGESDKSNESGFSC